MIFDVAAPIRVIIQANYGSGLDQPWSAYKWGFTDVNGGYWVGLEYFHQMTTNGHRWNLCADAKDGLLGLQYYVSYDTIVIDPETLGYLYHVSGLKGVPLDLMGPGNGKYKFTTKDVNNQPGSCENNAAKCKGGWWWGCNGDENIVLNGPKGCGFYFKLLILNIQMSRTYIRISQF